MRLLLSISALLANISVFVFCDEPDPNGGTTNHSSIFFLPMVTREKFFNTTDSVDLCAVQCDDAVETAEDSKEFLTQVAQSSIFSVNFTNFAALFDKEKLTKICNDTGTVLKCVNECPDRPWKDRMTVLYDPLTYACSGSNFLNHVDCLRNVYREDKGQCETLPQCRKHRDQVVSTAYLTMMSLEGTPTLQSTSLGSDMMKQMCKYVECANDCRSPEIVTKCSQKANDELLMFYRRFMNSIKLLMSLYHSARTDSELKFDDTCDKLGTVNA